MSLTPRQVACTLLAEVLYELQRQLKHSLAALRLSPCQIEHFFAAPFLHLYQVVAVSASVVELTSPACLMAGLPCDLQAVNPGQCSG